jgi:glycosyltransferase involved in cell wall biosynthesis
MTAPAQARPELSVVVPVYRSRSTLRELVTRLHAVLEKLGRPWEIVLVDDGSPDDSWAVLDALAREQPGRLVAVQLMRNYGQHNTLMCGFRHARGELVLTMDDDLQNPPEEIPRLLEAMRTGEYDLVYGAYARKRHFLWRNAASTLMNGFFRLVFGSPGRITAFRVIRRPLLDCVVGYTPSFVFVDGLLAWNTQRVGYVEVAHDERRAGRSGYSFGKLTILFFNVVTNFSLYPLQLVSYCGLAVAALGIGLGAYEVLKYFLTGFAVAGYASTIVAILTLGGIQLLSLGMIGEYLGRMHLHLNQKPQYNERRVAGVGTDGTAESKSVGRPT